MLVKDVMSTKVEAVRPTTTIGECARKMEQLGVGALPVWQDGQSLGLVTDRDICCRVVGTGKDPAKTAVREIMTEAAATCFEDQDCREAARGMTNKGVRRLMVINHNHATVWASSRLITSRGVRMIWPAKSLRRWRLGRIEAQVVKAVPGLIDRRRSVGSKFVVSIAARRKRDTLGAVVDFRVRGRDGENGVKAPGSGR